MFLKTLDEKQKFKLKNMKLILKNVRHSYLHGKMNFNNSLGWKGGLLQDYENPKSLI